MEPGKNTFRKKKSWGKKNTLPWLMSRFLFVLSPNLLLHFLTGGGLHSPSNR